MRVYRIQNRKHGLGPYAVRPKDLPREHDSHMHRWKECPTPYNDGIEQFCSGVHHCGFDSLAAMREWFGIKVIEELVNRHNFMVVELEVPKTEVLKGRRQIAYNHAKAKLVREMALDEIEYGREFQMVEINRTENTVSISLDNSSTM